MTKLAKYLQFLGNQISNKIEDAVLEFLPTNPSAYLDCGCDTGEKTISRANKMNPKKIYGLEVEKTRSVPAEKLGIKVVNANLNTPWPIKANSIDVITATEVVEHLENLDNFFAEAHRVLVKKGTLILSTENLAAWHNVFALILGNQPYTGPWLSRKYPIGHRPNAHYYKSGMSKTMYPHINVMTIKALKQLLVANGFKITNVKPTGYYPFPYPLASVFNKLDKYHSSYVVIAATKK